MVGGLLCLMAGLAADRFPSSIAYTRRSSE
jgi:hypothetical protein